MCVFALRVVFALLCVHATRSALCPAGCECSEAAQTVKCVSKDLQDIPTGIPTYTRNLFITGNHIRRIGPECFKGLDNVTTLSLSNNRISEVASHTFSSLRNLRSLDLSSNQLVLIHPEAFIMHNHTLRELNFSRALYNHSSVTNLATALRWSSLDSLLGLDLSSNGLIFLPPYIFFRMSSLRRLQLANNSIVSITNETLLGLEHLEELDLSHNALKTFNKEGLTELERIPKAKLYLGQNPYTCTCGIEPFIILLNTSLDRVVDAEHVVCVFPVELRNVSLLLARKLVLECYHVEESNNLALQTSYVFLGIVLGFVGLMFLFVLYLNRKGIKKRIYEMRDTCREMWEGYHYRYEIDSDPRLSQLSTSADV
ncbi:trophoblast glycoprotein a [Ictalurus punctatus]|uniref:Trophoblast glycoprotein n=1 Tax=Ictalurus punctatus TaxID=7998 RepID=W5UKI6_ICTPU|nr:trophoblast glycoprotein a [Ictalurus punctatus]XP_017336172.1 trophoblast glycoprotein a [Ictalurus punctatus]